MRRAHDLDEALPTRLYQRESLPWEAGFLAGKCFLKYRRRGGPRSSTLPDFYIGAHAAVGHLALLTRDVARYRSYFPTIEILAPTEPQIRFDGRCWAPGHTESPFWPL